MRGAMRGVAVAAAAGLIFGVPGASATEYTVAPGDALSDVDGVCELREAVIAANSDGDFNECAPGSGDDTILLQGGTYATGGVQLALNDIDAGDTLEIRRASSAPVTVTRSNQERVFVVSTAATGGVTIDGITMSGGSCNACIGGGIAVQGASVLTITNSTFSNNAAGYLPGDTISDGGAIGSGNTAVQVTLRNVTFSGNHANDDGGAIAMGANVAASWTFDNVTIANNRGDFDNDMNGDGGGLHRGPNAVPVTLRNSIIAGNTANSGPDCIGTMTAAFVTTSNLIGDPTGCNYAAVAGQDIVNTNPLLGDIAPNNGPTPTLALAANSPAIDKAIAPCPPTDQRGILRPQGAGCDLGAFERAPSDDPVAITPTPITGTPAPGIPAAKKCKKKKVKKAAAAKKKKCKKKGKSKK